MKRKPANITLSLGILFPLLGLTGVAGCGAFDMNTFFQDNACNIFNCDTLFFIEDILATTSTDDDHDAMDDHDAGSTVDREDDDMMDDHNDEMDDHDEGMDEEEGADDHNDEMNEDHPSQG